LTRILVRLRTRRRLLVFAGAVSALGMLPAAGVLATGGAQSANLERRVKAAFLYKFLGYTDFPPAAFADAAAPLVIGVLAADDVAGELAKIVAGRQVQARPVSVKVVSDGESLAGLHLLFVGGADASRVRAALKGAPAAAILVVSESAQGLQHGSVINFKVIEDRVRFDVSLDAAERHSIKLSSRLLTVANQVHKGAP
jgi:hypothetical protein